MKPAARLITFLVFSFCLTVNAYAFEHEDSPVKFLEYGQESLDRAKKENKPVFILISAIWCHWCKVFAHDSLGVKKVYEYLNQNYISIFIDADIRRDLLFRFKGTTLPYVVLLAPDGFLLNRYGGSLSADDFLGHLQAIRKKALSAKTGQVKQEVTSPYKQPEKLDPQNITELKSIFLETFLENFDEDDFGLGAFKKFVLPITSSYLIDLKDENVKRKFLPKIRETIKKAVDSIYDPVEGGFFRYAEKSDWRVPHYEKMLDTNSAMIFLLYRLNSISKSPGFEQAARNTVRYISTKLYSREVGSFLSFQVADTDYYSLNKKERKKNKEPEVVRKIFADRLAVSLVYLLDALPYMKDAAFEEKIKRSINFLAKMAREPGGINRFYSVKDAKWSLEGNLGDHAYLAYLFSKAFKVYGKPEYLHLSKKILGDAMALFYDTKDKHFSEKSLTGSPDLEYLMELNGVFTLALLANAEMKPDPKEAKIINGVINYFSGTGELLSERAFSASDFRFMEKYAMYLNAAESFIAEE